VRIAFVDLNFSWPANGGADVDLYHVALGIQEAGHDVCLFVVHESGSSERGRVEPRTLPFPATRLDCTRSGLRPAKLCPRLRQTVDSWHPDVVFLQHGYALKPYVCLTFADYRTVARYYAHELTCARDARRFRDGHPCPKDFLRTPDFCRACALEGQRAAIRSWRLDTWNADYLAARAYQPEYHDQLTASLRSVNVIIVYNYALKNDLCGFHDQVAVIPSGVHMREFEALPSPAADGQTRKVILMSGRAEDPLKGLDTLLEAGRRLRGRRNDFEIRATHFDPSLSTEWVRALGWRDHASALRLYETADIVVAPSLWMEPFGIVAVEAMAAGRPVCASNIGGLRDIVRDGATGLLFTPGDAEALARCLEMLLDDPGLRARMGAEGRRTAAGYDWHTIIERHYLPLLENLCRD